MITFQNAEPGNALPKPLKSQRRLRIQRYYQLGSYSKYNKCELAH